MIFLLIQIVYAQSTDLEFQHFTTSDGLVTNWMRTCPIEQDVQGFIWIGSDHGLHKYDGYKFTVYTHDKNDSSSISNSSVKDIHTDHKGRLWIATNSGLNRWLPEQESFKHFFISDSSDSDPTYVPGISEDSAGNLWFYSGGALRRFNPETETFKAFYNNLFYSDLQRIYIDKHNIIWIGGENGLIKFNPGTSEISHFDLRSARFNNSSDNTVTCIAEDLSGRLLVGGKSGLYYFDRKTETIEALRNLNYNSIAIWVPKAVGNETVLGAGNINYIFQSPTTKEYWIGSESVGVNRFDESGKLIHHYNQDFTYSILEDRGGVTWLGTGTNGIYIAKSSANNFKPQGMDVH
jgi:ligand-binding sensor domain-containing protein